MLYGILHCFDTHTLTCDYLDYLQMKSFMTLGLVQYIEYYWPVNAQILLQQLT